MSATVMKLPPSVASILRSSVALPTMSSIAVELVYNSLDAGASDIQVLLDLTKWTLEVRDDGHGIGLRDLQVIGERHATSKLVSAEQLEREGVRTYGFRGEAIHCLASISSLEIISCSSGSSSSSSSSCGETHAAQIRFGERQGCSVATERRFSVGTSIVARDCFLNRPVARKQLQKQGAAQAELEQARRQLAAIALSQPSVSLRLIDGSRHVCLLNAPRSPTVLGSLRRLMQGVELPPLIDLGHKAAAPDDFAVFGHLAMPPAGLRSRECQHLYLNGRPLSRRSELHRLCEAAFARVHDVLAIALQRQQQQQQQQQPSRRHPHTMSEPSQRLHAVYILFLSCAPRRFDLTLEPDKSDAIFADGGRAISAFLLDALARAFAAHAPPPLHSRQAISQLLAGVLQRGDGASSASRREGLPSRAASPAAAPADTATAPDCFLPLASASTPAPAASTAAIAPRPHFSRKIARGGGRAKDSQSTCTFLVRSTAPPAEASLFDTSMLAQPAPPAQPASISATATPVVVSFGSRRSNNATTTAAAASAAAAVVSRELLHELQALGQMERKFILASARGRLFIIDQHAADERVQLERLTRATVDGVGMPIGQGPGGGGVEQRRLRPVARLSLTPGEMALLVRHEPRLRGWGWQLREAGEERTVYVEAVPAVEGVELQAPAMLEYAADLEATGGGTILPPPAVRRVLASKACRRAVMFGDALRLEQCQGILQRLAACDLPFQCAHGRPTVAQLLEQLPVLAPL